VAKRIYTLTDPEPRAAYEIDYDTLLNDEQREVVMAGAGPLLVLAGAGTGKTRALTFRVARLLESGISPERLLLLTFTNKAAREMLSRVGSLLGEVPKNLWGGTFHHIGAMTLRRHCDRIGFPNEFNILDTEDTQSVMALAVADSGIDTTQFRFPRANVLCKLYSLAVNTCRPPLDVIIEKRPEFSPLAHDMVRIFEHFKTRKRELGAMDYDDLLLKWLELLEECEDVLREYSYRFEHVLVDEYQDTNQLQGMLIDRLASFHNNLMVVGDDCQSIFRFRGAEFSNILDFPKRHENTQIFKLQTNYRSTPQILALANQSIRYNSRQFHKTLQAVQPDDELPAVVTCKNVEQQASFVAQRVLEIRDEGVPLNEMAVLYRAHYQSMELQMELGRRGIPYIVRSGQRFFEQAHIKDVISFLRLAHNPHDQLSFHRVLRTANGIGKKLGERIWSQLQRYDDPAEGWEADGIADGLPSRAAKSWDKLRKNLLNLQRGNLAGSRPGDMVQQVMDGGYKAYVRRSYENVDNRLGDLQQLANFATGYKELEPFLTEVALQGSIAAEDVADGGDLDEHLILSSIHQSKGLEFRAVFILWLSEGRFPTVRAEDPESIEEERRLFYVSTTRAKNELYLCHPVVARDRERGITILRPSPFVTELGKDLYDEWILGRA